MSFGWVSPPFCFPWNATPAFVHLSPFCVHLGLSETWSPVEKLTARELLSVPLALFGSTIDLFLSCGGVFLFALSLPILINSLLCDGS